MQKKPCKRGGFGSCRNWESSGPLSTLVAKVFWWISHHW